MLGLSNSCSTSSYLPFSSTRALSLDGSNEYIDTGDTFQANLRGDYSISFWAKPSDGRTSQMIFNAENSSGEDEIYFELGNFGVDGGPRFVMNSNADVGEWHTDSGDGSGFNFAAGAASSWTHFVITVDLQASGNTIVKIYVNGVDKAHEHAHLVSSQHDDYTSDVNLVLGARNIAGSLDKFYEGGIDEFAIWSSVLSANAALALYNNGSPTELSSPITDVYTAQADLLLWYRCGDGHLDDIGDSGGQTSGITYNQVGAKTLGSEELTNGTFDSDLSSWTVINDGAAEDSITWDSSGRAKIIYDADGTEAALGITQDTLTAGKVYRCQLDVEVIKVGSTLKVFNEAEIVSSLGNGTNIFYFRATNTHFRIYRNSASVDCEVYIDNVSVKEIGPSNSGIITGDVSSFDFI
jgi:hypothetical protein